MYFMLFSQSNFYLNVHEKNKIIGRLLNLSGFTCTHTNKRFIHVDCALQQSSRPLFSPDKWACLLLPKMPISTAHFVGNQQSRDEYSGGCFWQSACFKHVWWCLCSVLPRAFVWYPIPRSIIYIILTTVSINYQFWKSRLSENNQFTNKALFHFGWLFACE